ncbi:MAG: hypothetical protein LBV47_00825 [Bacteroidales bacterium]|jgi:hypothetical protein|nr:hypothetical protein [Bacteroidales bacterium]
MGKTIITILALLAVLILWMWVKWSARRTERNARAWKERMRRTAVRRLEVDLTDCEVVSNSWVEEVPRHGNTRLQAYDQMYDPERSVERVGINRSRLVWRDPATGKTYASPIIAKDDITLKFLLLAQKQTVIYVGDGGIYYFDLEFLD